MNGTAQRRVVCPTCTVHLPADHAIGSGPGRRWTCTRCGARFDADNRLLSAAGGHVTSQVVFGARVRARRRSLGLSVHALAELAGMSDTFLKQIERGVRNPSLLTVVRLSAALDLDPANLVIGLR